MNNKIKTNAIKVSKKQMNELNWTRQMKLDYYCNLNNLVTIATDSGFASQDFNQWPIFVPIWMLFLSCLSASSGSTGGGIRMIRTIILIKQARLEMFKFIHPFAIRPMKIGGSVISNNIITSVMGFIFLYFIHCCHFVFGMASYNYA